MVSEENTQRRGQLDGSGSLRIDERPPAHRVEEGLFTFKPGPGETPLEVPKSVGGARVRGECVRV